MPAIADATTPSTCGRSHSAAAPSTLRELTVAVMWRRIGPYHSARLEAAAQALAARSATLSTIEVAGREGTYDWDVVETPGSFRRRTLFPGAEYSRLSPARIRARLRAALDEVDPDVVAVNGWAFPESHAAIAWCRRHRRALVVMAEMNTWRTRLPSLREAAKRWLVAQCDAALIGGSRHRDYLVKLGMPLDHVFFGYDVVDNAYFARETRRCRTQRGSPPRPHLLSVLRFVWQKNLIKAMRAYARYVRAAGDAAWDWVLCGDGPLKDKILAARRAHGLEEKIRLTGFVQLDQLPQCYADAGALWLPSISETWGLVVNEAMAAGLPVLVSRRAGCSADLVEPGGNGWTFDPMSIDEMTGALLHMHRCDNARRAEMGRRSQAIIAGWQPSQFGEGLWSATRAALTRAQTRRGQPAIEDRILLWMLDR